MLKEIVKTAKMPVKARILPQGKCLVGRGLQTRSPVRGAKQQAILTGTMCVFLSGPHWVFADVILKFREKIEKLEKDVYAVLRLEREEREMQQSEAQVSIARACSYCLGLVPRYRELTPMCMGWLFWTGQNP